MSRCKACNTPFSGSSFHNESEDLCSYCRFISNNPQFCDIREYQFESITEVPVYVENYKNTIDKDWFIL